MDQDIPGYVKGFIYPMHGVIKNKNICFLTPTRISHLKEDKERLKAQCNAIVWILTHKTVNYADWNPKCHDIDDVISFASCSAIIFLHEKLFELSGVKFDETLISAGIIKDNVLKFYVDPLQHIQIMRYMYSDFKNVLPNDYSIYSLNENILAMVIDKKMEMLESLLSISNFDALDCANALQDYEKPERAALFFKKMREIFVNLCSDKEL